MKDKYTSEKQALIKTTNRVMLIPLFVLILLVTIFARIAIRPGANTELLTYLPSGDAAFGIAKDFIRPSLHSSGYRFSDDYRLTKVTDSIYVLRSSYESTKNEEPVTTSFTIRLRYEGGDKDNFNNWSELNFEER